MQRALVFSGLLFAACSGPSVTTGAASSSSSSGGVPERVVLDAPVPGASIRVVPVFTDDGSLVVELRLSGAGEVFGLSYHVGFDASRLALTSGGDGQVPVLGDGALHLFRAGEGDVALGGTRRSKEDGEALLDGETLLATLRFAVTGTGPTRISVVKPMVRRSSGSFVPVAGLGAEVRP